MKQDRKGFEHGDRSLVGFTGHGLAMPSDAIPAHDVHGGLSGAVGNLCPGDDPTFRGHGQYLALARPRITGSCEGGPSIFDHLTVGTSSLTVRRGPTGHPGKKVRTQPPHHLKQDA